VGTLLVVICCLVGSWVQHDAPGALRGLFYLVGMLLAVVHSAVTSPLLPFFLSCFFYHGRFGWCSAAYCDLVLVHVVGDRSVVQSVPACRPAY
jgi:hypothetical protein